MSHCLTTLSFFFNLTRTLSQYDVSVTLFFSQSLTHVSSVCSLGNSSNTFSYKGFPKSSELSISQYASPLSLAFVTNCWLLNTNNGSGMWLTTVAAWIACSLCAASTMSLDLEAI